MDNTDENDIGIPDWLFDVWVDSFGLLRYSERFFEDRLRILEYFKLYFLILVL